MKILRQNEFTQKIDSVEELDSFIVYLRYLYKDSSVSSISVRTGFLRSTDWELKNDLPK